MKFKVKIDNDILALLIACLAVSMAFWEGYESRQHNRKSVMPILNSFVNKEFGEQMHSFEIGVRSVGLGPGSITHFTVFFNGKEQEVYRAPGYSTSFHTPRVAVQGIFESTESEEGEPYKLIFQDNELEAGDVMAEEERRIIFRFESDLPREEFVKAVDVVENTLDIFICYCSVYEDQCQYTHVGSNEDMLPQSCQMLIEESD